MLQRTQQRRLSTIVKKKKKKKVSAKDVGPHLKDEGGKTFKNFTRIDTTVTTRWQKEKEARNNTWRRTVTKDLELMGLNLDDAKNPQRR